MSKRTTFAELRAMSAEERKEALDSLLRDERALSPQAGARAEAFAHVQDFEIRNGLSTAEMARRLFAGELVETEQVCRWLMAARLYERVSGERIVGEARSGDEG